MCHPSDCSPFGFCRLITDSLQSYTEPEVVLPLTKEATKDLLLALSQVLRVIELWTQKLEEESDNDTAVKSSVNDNVSADCMTKILTDLVLLLTIKSRYVQHAAGNVLVALSQFLTASGSIRDLCIHFLCASLELSISCALSCSSARSTDRIKDSSSISSSFVVVLKPKLKNASWSTVAEITRVLRSVLKILKQEHDDKLCQIFLDSVCSCISNLSCFTSQIPVLQTSDSWKMDGQSGCYADALHLRNTDLVVFLGVFLQFLCSLVQESSSMEAVDESPVNHPVLFVIISLVPELLSCCLCNHGDLGNPNISRYYGYKLLVLMVRLSFQTRLDCSIYVSWLQLLHNYFQDHLLQPITKYESDHDKYLEGSPFLLHFSHEEMPTICTRHLQRRAILLFLRCSFSLISSRKDSIGQCACATVNSCLVSDTSLDLDCCNTNKGLLELYKWLQRHVPVDVLVDHEMYKEKCMDFAASFIHLFVHEDDLLFKILLQLLNLPLCVEKQSRKEKWTLQNMKEKILFHVANIFNPIYLFLTFLAELCYDHQVLLDYLISNDTGISCTEYLLKCLRVLCDSWQLFKGVSVGGKVTNQSSSKRRKVKFQADVPSANEAKTLGSKEPMKGCECGDQHCGTRLLSYTEAKNCLLSLKRSVENLHKKNLFPYNPDVLLKRCSCYLPFLIKIVSLCFQ